MPDTRTEQRTTPAWITSMREKGYQIREATADSFPVPEASFPESPRLNLFQRLFERLPFPHLGHRTVRRHAPFS